MPQCPHCQTPYEEGQRYCKMCGSFLLHREQGDIFCPQCGVRVSPRQEFCHECDAPIKEAEAASKVLEPEPESEAPSPEPPPAPAPPTGIPAWVIGLLVGSGIIIIILLVMLFTRGTSTPPVSTPAPKVEAPAPAPTATSLKEQLQNVLSTIREAQLHKDIFQFMSVYSLTYPELDDKRANTLQSWEHYDYTSLVFTVDKIESIDPDNAIAWITWYVDTRNRRTQELSSSTQKYKVRFAKELGKWRIRSLEEVEE
jgi:uncharacterized Zn finger protein (UPF0148 family)